MGYDRNRVRGALVPQVICGICDLVLEDALQVSLPGCQHVFCRKCIDTRLTSEATCPLDGEHLTPSDLIEEPFLINFFLENLDIACDFASLGCEAFVKLTELSDHVKGCSYRSQLSKKCGANCGAVLKKDSFSAEFPEHSCVTYLLEVNESLRKECEEAKERETRCSETMSTQKAEIIRLKKEMESLNSHETRRVSTRTTKEASPEAKRPVADFLMEPIAQEENGGSVLLAIEGTPSKVIIDKFLEPKPKGSFRSRGRPKGVKNRRKLKEVFQGSSSDETTEEEEPEEEEEEEEEEDKEFVDDEDDLDYVPKNKQSPNKRKTPPPVVQTASKTKKPRTSRKHKAWVGLPEFICPHIQCRKVFDDPELYRDHVKNHPKGQPGARPLSHFEFGPRKPRGVRNRNFDDQEVESRPFKCTVGDCIWRFKTQVNLSNHEVNVHGKEPVSPSPKLSSGEAGAVTMNYKPKGRPQSTPLASVQRRGVKGSKVASTAKSKESDMVIVL